MRYKAIIPILFLLAVSSPQHSSATDFNNIALADFGAQINNFRESVQSTVPKNLPTLPEAKTKLTEANKAKFNKLVGSVIAGEEILKSTIQKNTLLAASVISNVKSKVVNTPALAPVAAPKQTVPSAAPTLKNTLPTITNILQPASPVSTLDRTTKLENDLLDLRKLVSRQNDRSVQNVSQTISEITNGGSADLSAQTGTFVSTLATSGLLSASTANISAATTTSLYVSSLASTTELRANTANIGSLTVVSCTGCSASSGSSNSQFATTTIANSNGLFPNGGSWVDVLIGGTATTSNAKLEVQGNFLTTGSTTLQNFTASNSTSSQATTTSLFVSGRASSTDLRANTSFIGFLTSVFGSFTNILANGSTTLQNFTASNSTSSQATTTSLYVSGTASTTDLRANTSFLGSLTSVFGSFTNILANGSTTLQSFTASQGTTTAATSTNLYTTTFAAQGSTTLQNFTASNSTSSQATTTSLYVSGTASTTDLRANTSFLGFLTSVFGSFTNILANGSTTLQNFTASNSTSSQATTTSLFVSGRASSTDLRANTSFIGFLTSAFGSFTNILANGSTTLQNFTGGNSTSSQATTTSLFVSGTASTTDLRANTSFLGSLTSVFGSFTNILANGSTTLQNFTASNSTSSQATTTSLYVSGTASTTDLRANTSFLGFLTSAFGSFTNILANGSTTLQNFTGGNSTSSQATTTSLYASSGISVGSALNFIGRATTTLAINDTAWVIATSAAATNPPLMSFNNSAGTSTIQFFGATTTGLTATVGVGIPTGNYVLVGDGKAPASINILKGGLCVDSDGWCTASTTGRISSVSSFIGNSDLAEMYHATEAVEQGDVVSVVGGINVAKARRGEKDKMMGVVSTNPGVVLGSGPDREGVAGDVPIALAGRVPLKVSAENGAIHAGDYLALSSISGVGARATKAGVVIGQALEDYSGAGVGKILVFVKNSYYSGTSLDSLPGMTAYSGSDSHAILAALMSGAHTTLEVPSDIAVDRMSAAIEVVTPKITTNMLFATSIESPTITNLTNQLTTQLSMVQADLAVKSGALDQRISTLENASTSPAFISALADKVKLALQSASEWTMNKITATLGIFNRVEVETAHVSKGIEMVDTATGMTYCITIVNGEFDKKLGECGLTVVPPPSSPNTPPPEVTSTSTEDTLSDIVSTTTEEVVTPPSESSTTTDETPNDSP